MQRRSFPLLLAVCVNLSFAGATGAMSTEAAHQATKADAVREHLDEAEDLVESLLRWKHVPVWPVERPTGIPVDAPKNTLISIGQQEAKKLVGLVEAILAQVPASTGGAAPRGDLRAHAEQARTIARELMPDTTSSPGNLVTIDRTALLRLEIELDAIEELLPRTMPRS